jgi:hypothetical protein
MDKARKKGWRRRWHHKFLSVLDDSKWPEKEMRGSVQKKFPKGHEELMNLGTEDWGCGFYWSDEFARETPPEFYDQYPPMRYEHVLYYGNNTHETKRRVVEEARNSGATLFVVPCGFLMDRLNRKYGNGDRKITEKQIAVCSVVEHVLEVAPIMLGEVIIHFEDIDLLFNGVREKRLVESVKSRVSHYLKMSRNLRGVRVVTSSSRPWEIDADILRHFSYRQFCESNSRLGPTVDFQDDFDRSLSHEERTKMRHWNKVQHDYRFMYERPFLDYKYETMFHRRNKDGDITKEPLMINDFYSARPCDASNEAHWEKEEHNGYSRCARRYCLIMHIIVRADAWHFAETKICSDIPYLGAVAKKIEAELSKYYVEGTEYDHEEP